MLYLIALLACALSPDSDTLPTTADSDTHDSDTPDSDTAPAEISASIDAVPTATVLLSSSTKADVAFTGSAYSVVRASARSDSGHIVRVQGTESPLRLDRLRSDSSYTVTVDACANADCEPPLATRSIRFMTPEENWQFEGTGHALTTLATVAANGQAKIWALTMGDEAGTGLAGRIQLYYGQNPSGAITGQSLGVATAQKAIVHDDTRSWYPLDPLYDRAGLVTPPTRTALLGQIGTGQPVPLRSGGTRMYFESNGNDGHTRILSIDSADGWVGQDFNQGASTLCSTTSDYTAGGGCPNTVQLGISTDTLHPVPKVSNVRQFKIGYPTLDDWRWDESAGTFMFFTVDKGGTCGYPGFANQAYAVWDGTQWEPVLRSDGCPDVIAYAQAPAPIHIGAISYKLYHGDPSQTTGVVSGSMLPFLGPKLLRYADGAQGGDPERVDLADWETTPHDLSFLWPDGTPFSASAEGYIDDFVFLMPTGNPEFQLAYVVITDGSAMPRPAVAKLLNP